MNIHFWKRVRDYAAKKVAECSNWSVKCPNCVRWTYEMSKDPVITDVMDEGGAPIWHMTCGDCGHVSRWIDGPFGIFLSIDKEIERAATV